MVNTSVAFVGVMALLIIVVGTTAAYVPQTSTTTQTSYFQQSTEETGSVEGLVLGATINASAVPQGKAISLQIWERNALDVKNNVTAESNWSYGALALGTCGSLNYPFGFKILAGYYAQDSPGLDSAQPIRIYEPGIYGCPAISVVSSYSFYPLSTRAILGCPLGPCSTETMNATSEIEGEYIGESANLSELTPGVYSVVVGDEWGASVFLYFTVFSNGSQESVLLPAGTSVMVSSSYDCVAGHFQLQFASPGSSYLVGGFATGNPGVSLYVATVQEALNLTQGHPSQWLYTSGMQNSTHFKVLVPQGVYVLWIEGADLNCGAKIVMPLEALTQVNITQSIGLTEG